MFLLGFVIGALAVLTTYSMQFGNLFGLFVGATLGFLIGTMFFGKRYDCDCGDE